MQSSVPQQRCNCSGLSMKACNAILAHASQLKIMLGNVFAPTRLSQFPPCQCTWGGLSAYGWCKWDLQHTVCPRSLQEAHGEATSPLQRQDPSTTGQTWSAAVRVAAPCRRGLGTSPGNEVHNFTSCQMSVYCGIDHAVLTQWMVAIQAETWQDSCSWYCDSGFW